MDDSKPPNMPPEGPDSLTKRSPAAHLPKWKPGQSGNPGGRPKGVHARIAAMTNDGQDILELFADVMKGRIKGTPRDRLDAAKELSNRLWGKAPEMVVNLSAHGSLGEAAAEMADVHLESLARALTATSPMAQLPEIIDVSPAIPVPSAPGFIPVDALQQTPGVGECVPMSSGVGDARGIDRGEGGYDTLVNPPPGARAPTLEKSSGTSTENPPVIAEASVQEDTIPQIAPEVKLPPTGPVSPDDLQKLFSAHKASTKKKAPR